MNATTTMGLSLSGADSVGVSAGQSSVQAGYGISLTDMSGFHEAIARAEAGAGSTLQAQPVQAMSEGMQALFKPLEHINAEAVSLPPAPGPSSVISLIASPWSMTALNAPSTAASEASIRTSVDRSMPASASSVNANKSAIYSKKMGCTPSPPYCTVPSRHPTARKEQCWAAPYIAT